jgi:hypothetical protein
VGEVAGQELVDEIDGPEDPVNEQQDPIVIVIPTDHQRIEAEDEIDDAGVSVHVDQDNKKYAYKCKKATAYQRKSKRSLFSTMSGKKGLLPGSLYSEAFCIL